MERWSREKGGSFWGGGDEDKVRSLSVGSRRQEIGEGDRIDDFGA